MRLWQGRPVRSVERIADTAAADERVLEHLARLGHAEEEALEASHFIYLPSASGAEAAAAALRREGWRISTRACDGDCWLVVATTVSPLTRARVRETRRALEALARANGGFYDGWEIRTG
jgi:hypothetical protein